LLTVFEVTGMGVEGAAAAEVGRGDFESGTADETAGGLVDAGEELAHGAAFEEGDFALGLGEVF